MPTFKGLFERFPNPLFIETGSFRGQGTAAAIWAGFPMIITIEKTDYYFEYCSELFDCFPNVITVKGDSGEALPVLLEHITIPATFWLDAHYSEQNTADGPSPLIKELEAINKHPVKTHTILIDDISDYDFEVIKSAIPDYKHFEFTRDILICQP
jgi:hypothetical protein